MVARKCAQTRRSRDRTIFYLTEISRDEIKVRKNCEKLEVRGMNKKGTTGKLHVVPICELFAVLLTCTLE